jgi:hypothetical protein
MKYIVLSEFADLQDEKHVYGIGDEYPRKGYSPSAERVDELSTWKNLLHKPLIQKVEEVEEPEKVEEVETEAVEEVEEPKRKRGRKTNA